MTDKSWKLLRNRSQEPACRGPLHVSFLSQGPFASEVLDLGAAMLAADDPLARHARLDVPLGDLAPLRIAVLLELGGFEAVRGLPRQLLVAKPQSDDVALLGSGIGEASAGVLAGKVVD